MKNPARHILASLCLLSVLGSANAQRPAETVAGQILIKPGKGLSETALHALLSRQGGREIDSIPQIGVRVISVPAAAYERILKALQADERLEFAEPNAIARAIATTNDPYYTGNHQWSLSKIQAPAAWDKSTGSAAVTVAVIDSGTDANHPDLKGKILPGYDFVNSDSDPSDDNGHGTAVAGVIGASTNNGIGMAAVAWATPVIPVKVLDASGSGSYSNIAKAINYSADNGARIINLSLGGTSSSRTLQNAVDYAWNKGSTLIAAAGNNGNNTAFYPAACNNVVAVSATNSSDTRPSWSNYGSYVDISAPGDSILTTYKGGYAYLSGTSFSSPVTAGVAALIASAKPSLSNTQLVDILLKNSDDLGAAGYDQFYGHGRVNANRAVTAAVGVSSPDTTAPLTWLDSPADGAIVQGTVNLSAAASDNVGVTKIELLVNGVVRASSSSNTISWNWDSTGVADGIHSITSRAYDAANNTSASSISVSVHNTSSADTIAPTVAITSPSSGSTVSGTVKIQISGKDNVAVTKIELFIDGKLFGTSTSSTATFNWNTRNVSKGEHQLQAYAYDAAGNIGASSLVKVFR
jgi:thermitase